MRAGSSIVVAMALTLLAAAPLAADTTSLKQQAESAFARMRYPTAQALARQATEQNPNDAEAWFLLGWYSHYRCYDSRPLSGMTRATSDSTLKYLERAVQLDPTLGDAFYFIGAEYGCRCGDALVAGDARRAKAELQAGRAKNAYPDWELEYCRNMLKCCAKDAILFMDHDIIVNGIRYLQIVEGYRPDITAVITMGRAGLTLPYKYGVHGAIRPAPTSWSREQILGMQYYPWNADTIRIPVGPAALKDLGISAPDTVLEWEVKSSSGLSAYMAQVIDIIETNRWQRPVYFSEPTQTAYVDSCLQNCGLVWRLLPVRASKYGLVRDTTTISRVLMDSSNYRDLATYAQHPMRRASGVLYGYCNGLLELAASYTETGDRSAYDAVIDRFAALGPPFFESAVPNFKERVEAFRKAAPPLHQ